MRRPAMMLLAPALAFASLGLAPETTDMPTPQAGAVATVNSLTFLEGTWRAESDGGFVEERWTAPASGNLTGMLRWINADGELTLLELLTINAEDGRAVFRWRHFDAELTPWKSEADGPSVVTIESVRDNRIVMRALPGRPGVQRMTYDGSAPGRLVATLEFGEDAGREPIVIEFERR